MGDYRLPGRGSLLVMAILSAVLLPRKAPAACPDALLDCFPNACDHAVVAEKFVARAASGNSAIASGGLCAAFGSMAGNKLASAEVRHRPAFFHTTTKKTAATFRGYRTGGAPAADSVLFASDLVSAGKPFQGLPFATIDGGLDTSGTHPDLAGCSGALAEVQAASDLLAALPADQTFGKILVAPDQEFRITITAPGLAVIAIESILMKTRYSPMTGFALPMLHIIPHPGTTGVVLNVAKNVRISNHGELGFESLLTPWFPIILNAYGDKAKVAQATESFSDALTLVPRGTAAMGKFTYSQGLFARNVLLRGAVTYRNGICTP